MQKELVS